MKTRIPMKDNGGSAFPSHGSMGEVAQEGMSLRDWFAGKALSGIVPQNSSGFREWEWYGEAAYKLADAMLEARDAN